MFNWDNSDQPVIVKLPFKIYWAATGSATVLFMILNFGLMYPEGDDSDNNESQEVSGPHSFKEKSLQYVRGLKKTFGVRISKLRSRRSKRPGPEVLEASAKAE